MGGFGCGLDLCIRREEVAVTDVLGDRRGKQLRILRDDRKLLAQVGQPVLSQVGAVKEYGAGGRIMESSEKIDDRGFAGATRPHNSHSRAGWKMKRRVPEHGG